MSDDIRDANSARAAIALFVIIALLIGADVIADYREGAGWGHIAVELAVLLTAMAGALFLWQQLGKTRVDLQEARAAAEQWRRESRALIEGLGAAIQRQFNSWQLTGAEAQVGLLLLKGFSHKEIAALRNTSERTVREQSRALYRKSGLSGRASLSAFFLEDLLLPESSAQD